MQKKNSSEKKIGGRKKAALKSEVLAKSSRSLDLAG